MTATEGILLKNTASDAKIINLYLNNESIGSTTGILKDGTYRIYVNGYLYKTIQVDQESSQNTYYVTKGDDIIKIEIGGDVKSSAEFATSDQGILFYFNIPS